VPEEVDVRLQHHVQEWQHQTKQVFFRNKLYSSAEVSFAACNVKKLSIFKVNY
jgi:hypothetical protein